MGVLRPQALDRYSRIRGDLAPRERLHLDALVVTIDSGIEKPSSTVLCHADLQPQHILSDSVTGTLTGLIDLGEVAIQDPAADFFGLWDYGRDFVERTLRAYCASDPGGMLCRSRKTYIGRRLLELYWGTTLDDRRALERGRRLLQLSARVT